MMDLKKDIGRLSQCHIRQGQVMEVAGPGEEYFTTDIV